MRTGSLSRFLIIGLGSVQNVRDHYQQNTYFISDIPPDKNPLHEDFRLRVKDTTLKFRTNNGQNTFISNEEFLIHLRRVENTSETIELFRDTQPQFERRNSLANSDKCKRCVLV